MMPFSIDYRKHDRNFVKKLKNVQKFYYKEMCQLDATLLKY